VNRTVVPARGMGAFSTFSSMQHHGSKPSAKNGCISGAAGSCGNGTARPSGFLHMSRRSTKPVRNALPITNGRVWSLGCTKWRNPSAAGGPDDIEAHYRRAWLLTQILEDYLHLRDRWYCGPKETPLWLKAEEPDLYTMFAEALTPTADLTAMLTGSLLPNGTMGGSSGPSALLQPTGS
jgi:hypothetical protein